MKQTIFAVATASGKAGVAIIRISGVDAFVVAEKMCEIKQIKPRYAVFTPIKTLDGVPIDNALVLCFLAPNSFTGENVVELHVHGGRAILEAVLAELGKIGGLRIADRGEFTRRAVENGKMDLTSAEGLADLIEAQTEAQRKQALRQMNGALATVYDAWRADLVHLMAWLEAYIDFPEEEIPSSVLDQIYSKINDLHKTLKQHLDDKRQGERLREGYKIVLLGSPNVGKSSLMNQLAQQDVAIVSSKAGTTRDVIEVRLDLNGYPVLMADTAGLRETVEEIESEGIKRALNKATEADLILYILDDQSSDDAFLSSFCADKILKIGNKIDQAVPTIKADLLISAKTGQGIDALLETLSNRVSQEMSAREEPTLTRLRHRLAVQECVSCLENAQKAPEIELMAEDIRLGMRALGQITGHVKIDELLDLIFKDFCIGK